MVVMLLLLLGHTATVVDAVRVWVRAYHMHVQHHQPCATHLTQLLHRGWYAHGNIPQYPPTCFYR